MMKDEVQLLFEYSRWANNRTMQAASALSAEEFTRDLGGAFRSVQETLVHIVCSERTWITYWKEPFPSSAILADLFDRDDALLHSNRLFDFAAVQSAWADVEKTQIEFVRNVTDESLRRMLPVLETQVSLAHLMQHLANHSTYHRGQVALMMRQLGRQAVATDFALFLMSGRHSS